MIVLQASHGLAVPTEPPTAEFPQGESAQGGRRRCHPTSESIRWIFHHHDEGQCLQWGTMKVGLLETED